MKKIFRAFLSISIVICILATSLFTGVFAATDNSSDISKLITETLKTLSITNDTKSDDIINSVTSVSGIDSAVWDTEYGFQKILATNGAIIKLNGVAVDGGTVRGHEGSITGILNVTASDSTFDVIVNLPIAPSYEDIECTKRADVTVESGITYIDSLGYDEEADLLVLTMDSGNYDICSNFMLDNKVVKAIIVTGGTANIGNSAFKNTSALRAFVFKNAGSIANSCFYASAIRYVDFGSESSNEYYIDRNAFIYSLLGNVYYNNGQKFALYNSAFKGTGNMTQMVVDADSVTTLEATPFVESDTTVVCNNATVAAAFANTDAKAVIDLSQRAFIRFYSEVAEIVNATTATELESVLKALPAYSETVEYTITENNDSFTVAITGAPEIIIAKTTLSDTQSGIDTVLSDFVATNDTVADEIVNAVSSVSGVESVVWNENYGFQKVLATNGAKITLNGVEVEGGTVRGHNGSITGFLTVTTTFDTTLNILVDMIIEPTYETINCTKRADVKFVAGTTYANSEGYDSEADLVVLNRESGWQITKSFMEGNKTVKAVIVTFGVSGVSDCAFKSTKLDAVVFASAANIGQQCFYASSVRYVEFGSQIKGSTETYIDKNAFIYSLLGNTYYNNCETLGLYNLTFGDLTSMSQLVLDVNTISHLDGVTFRNANVTVVCTNSTVAAKLANTDAKAVIDLSQRSFISFYHEVGTIISSASVDELDTILKALPSYNESLNYTISEVDGGFKVLINGLLEVVVPATTKEGIKNNVNAVLDDFMATNNTVDTDITSAVSTVPGVESVVWTEGYEFQKILATNGAKITLNGTVVDGGIVRGHQGSISGVLTVTTSFGDTFNERVGIIIDPTYENIDCSKRVNIYPTSEDKFSALAGSNADADLVVITMGTTNNIPASFFEYDTNKNTTVKAVIVTDSVMHVSDSAFRAMSGLRAVVFNGGVDNIANYAFYGTPIRYIDFGSKNGDLSIADANAFCWTSLENVYIGGYKNLTIGKGAFKAGDNIKMTQLHLDVDNVTSVYSEAIKNTITVVCNNEESVSAFDGSGAATVINAGLRTISKFDINCDLEVDVRDLVRFKKNLTLVENDTAFDLDGDGKSNAIDISFLIHELLNSSSKKK